MSEANTSLAKTCITSDGFMLRSLLSSTHKWGRNIENRARFSLIHHVLLKPFTCQSSFGNSGSADNNNYTFPKTMTIARININNGVQPLLHNPIQHVSEMPFTQSLFRLHLKDNNIPGQFFHPFKLTNLFFSLPMLTQCESC